MIKFFQPIADIQKTRAQFPITKNKEKQDCILLFNSTNKYAFSINEYPTKGSDLCVFTKGAPEKIWTMCTHVLENGVPVPKD